MEDEDDGPSPTKDEDMRETLGSRMRLARKRLKWTQPELASLVGVTPQAVSAWERDQGCTLDNAASAAQHLGVDLEWLLTGKGELPAKPANSKNIEQIGGIPNAGLTVRKGMTAARTPVLGVVKAGAWLEMDPISSYDEPLEFLPIPIDAGLPAESFFALKVEGTSLNRIAREGDFLVCLDIFKTSGEIRDRDLVIVQRMKPDGTREVTAKRASSRGGVFVMLPESDDPRWQDPITFDPDDGNEVAVIARVLWIDRAP